MCYYKAPPQASNGFQRSKTLMSPWSEPNLHSPSEYMLEIEKGVGFIVFRIILSYKIVHVSQDGWRMKCMYRYRSPVLQC